MKFFFIFPNYAPPHVKLIMVVHEIKYLMEKYCGE